MHTKKREMKKAIHVFLFEYNTWVTIITIKNISVSTEKYSYTSFEIAVIKNTTPWQFIRNT